jgi:hypothetical protein
MPSGNSPIFNYYNDILFVSDPRQNRSPAADRERMIATMLHRNISELAVNRFAWKNLPEGVDARFIEMCLLLNGCVVWYWDKAYDKLLAVRGNGQGYTNWLDNPVSYQIVGPGSVMKPGDTEGTMASKAFRYKTLSAYQPTIDYTDEQARDKGIGMWPNYFRKPELDIINIYAPRLATLDRTLEINSKNARRNKILRTTQDTQLSVVNMNRQIDEGVEAIQVTGPLSDMDAITSLDLGVDPTSFDALSILRTRMWNECMNLLGIDNANQDKKERLVAAEVGANDSQTDSMRFVSLNARRKAIEHVNQVFGQNIEVDFNVEVEAQEKAQEAMDMQQGGDDNADVHNAAEKRN